MCRSIDCYDTDPGSQATYHDSHKIAFSLWQMRIRTVECGILTIKKSSVRALQIGLYPVFWKKNKKKFDRKKHSFISTSLQLQPWKNKDNDFLCQLCFLSLYLVWLVSSRNTRTRCEICSKLKDIRMMSLASICCLYC